MAGPRGMWVRLATQNFTLIGSRGGNVAQKISKISKLVRSRLTGVNPLTDF